VSDTLTSIVAPLAYLRDDGTPIQYRIYPPSAGRATVRPPVEYHEMPIRDGRPRAASFSIEVEGLAFHRHPTRFRDFYDETAVRARCYPEVAAFLRGTLGAEAVIVFDHNTRSVARAARGDGAEAQEPRRGAQDPGEARSPVPALA